MVQESLGQRRAVRPRARHTYAASIPSRSTVPILASPWIFLVKEAQWRCGLHIRVRKGARRDTGPADSARPLAPCPATGPTASRVPPGAPVRAPAARVP